ncbi:MAG TPA: hypothetical protein VN771_04380 [Candidatus Baltobacteraceae bacterium]|nr:hypothetical protein [Candidatus Baltobacteraceae bacterium]
MSAPRKIPDPARPSIGARLVGQITPGRIAVLVAFAIAIAVIGYAARIDQTDAQLPLLTTGFVLLGLAFLTLAVWGCLALIRAGGDEDGRTAFFAALLGGLSAIAAAAALGGAVVLALIWKTSS